MIPRVRATLGSVRPLSRSVSSSPWFTASTPLPPLPVTPGPTSAVPQAPNTPQTWSTSQQSRPPPASSPRFEQIAYEFQPAPLSAMEMINNEPIIFTETRIAVCEGGGGPLGHPKIYINLDKPGSRPCGYCGLRFERAHRH